MRAVIDANVIVSGLPWHGLPPVVMELVHDGVIELISSSRLLVEFEDVIGRRKLASVLVRLDIDPAQMLAGMRSLAEIIDTPPYWA